MPDNNKDNLLIKMGKRIAARRKTLKMTQEEFADRLGVSVPMVSNLEQGKKAIRPENLVKVCEELGLSADYLLTGKTVTSGDASCMIAEIESLDVEEICILRTIAKYMKSKK